MTTHSEHEEGAWVLEQVLCPDGHEGPWRYVEAIEVWREVRAVASDGLTVDSEWRTSDGYDDGVACSAHLMCWATDTAGVRCAERVELPVGLTITWD